MGVVVELPALCVALAAEDAVGVPREVLSAREVPRVGQIRQRRKELGALEQTQVVND